MNRGFKNMKQYIKRLKPNEDLKLGIENLVKDNEVKAGCLLSVVGSLSKLTLRVADGKTVKSWEEEFEIVSGTGTVSLNGSHIHISASKKDGETVGGHIKEGCIINTTAEIVILDFEDVKFNRIKDNETGYDELFVE